MLSKARAEKRQAREPKLNDTGEAFMPDDRSVADSTSTWGLVNVDAGDGGNPNDDMRVSSSKLPWAICKLFTYPLDTGLMGLQRSTVEA
jgi:1-phosphatidylinositol-3-phosphate 5-kinase